MKTKLIDPGQMSLTEVAALTQRSEAAVSMLVFRKRIPHRKPAGRIIFLRDEIEEWVRSTGGVTLAQVLEKAKK
jgi:predicted DNA-binding transcriptional regulator AlpA